MSLTLRTNLCLLLITVVSADEVYRFSRAGQSITLPCDRLSNYPTECEWFDYRDPQSEGQLIQGDPRRRQNQDCSLSLHNVTGADAGLYLCRLRRRRADYDTNVHLSVLTVSQTVVSESQTRLRCVLRPLRGFCRDGRIEWRDQDGALLSEGRDRCESEETVEQSHDVRTFTCSYEERGQVVSAGIRVQRSRGPPQETETSETETSETETSETETSGFPLVPLHIAFGAGLLLLLMLIVSALMFLNTKPLYSQQQTEVFHGGFGEQCDVRNHQPPESSSSETNP
ncbi:unnamed protein product [Knipowitschia caucasica]|uniref:Ig-like domain-containing protein n=1 Tax=Knipowitschia caucasica TaxID=637954 RepID=A0AAV2K9P7_KNICA